MAVEEKFRARRLMNNGEGTEVENRLRMARDAVMRMLGDGVRACMIVDDWWVR